jgi:hypothetical protein
MGIKNKSNCLKLAFMAFIFLGSNFKIRACEHRLGNLVQSSSLELGMQEPVGIDEAGDSPINPNRKLGRVDSLDMYQSREKNSETSSRSSGRPLSFAFAGTFDFEEEEEELAGRFKRSETIYVNPEFAQEYKKALASGSGVFGKREHSVVSEADSLDGQEVESGSSVSGSRPLPKSLSYSPEARLIIDELDEGGSMIGNSVTATVAKRELLPFPKINIGDGQLPGQIVNLTVFGQAAVAAAQVSSDHNQVSANPLSLPTQESVSSNVNDENIDPAAAPVVMIYNKNPDASLDRLSCWQQVLNCFCCKGNEKQ